MRRRPEADRTGDCDSPSHRSSLQEDTPKKVVNAGHVDMAGIPETSSPSEARTAFSASLPLVTRMFLLGLVGVKRPLYDRTPGGRRRFLSACAIRKVIHVHRVLGGTADRRGQSSRRPVSLTRWRLEGLTVSDEAG
jgi:hypothetical protein